MSYRMTIIVGTILKQGNQKFNSALIFMSDEPYYHVYHKRALWGGDRDHFTAGKEDGVICVDGLKVGVRICYEIRFPEYFRELYKKHTALNIILFHDTCEESDEERYGLIMGHIRTRAVENVCCTLTVNTARVFQTAPTCLIDKSGCVLKELERQSV